MIRKTKRSQMEIMGLAIIVILLFLGMVFVIKFVVLKAPKEYKKEYVNTELASNIIGAMLYTTIPDCSMITFAKLFQDCAGSEAICCADDCSIKSCAYAKTNVGDILESTLGKEEGALNLKYHFQVMTNELTVGDLEFGEPCPGERKQKRYPLPGAATIYVVLDICG